MQTMFLVFFLTLTRANYNCEGGRCESPIICTDSDNSKCSITCSEFGCQEKQFICDSSLHPCNILCTTQDACLHLNINSSIQSPELNITCEGEQSCIGMQIDSSSTQLSVDCNAHQSCMDMFIITDSFETNIKCTSHRSCQSTEISAVSNNVNLINMECSSNSISSCIDVNMYCDNMNYGLCKSSCINEEAWSNACENNFIYCNQNNNKCYGTNGFVVKYEGNKYITVHKRMSWYNAEQYCLHHFGTHLATIASAKDFHNINLYRNTTINTWIGMNKIGKSTDWKWADSASCSYVDNGRCVNVEQWVFDESNSTYDCATMAVKENGEWISANCSNEYIFMCNAINYDDYVCITDQNNNQLLGVLEYDHPYQYILDRYNYSGNIFTLQNTFEYWSMHLITNNGSKLIGNCSDQFAVLPYNCKQWNWIDNYQHFQISKCKFDNLCFNENAEIFEFAYWEYINNGATYYNSKNNYYLYPEIYLNESKHTAEYIMADDSNTTASCFMNNDISSNYVFDINECNEWISENTSPITIKQCPIIPIDTETMQLRLYIWYDMQSKRSYWDEAEDHTNFPHYALINSTLSAINSFNINTPGYITNLSYCGVAEDPDNNAELDHPRLDCMLSKFPYNPESISEYFAWANFEIVSTDITAYESILKLIISSLQFEQILSNNIDFLINLQESKDSGQFYNDHYFDTIKITLVSHYDTTTTTAATTLLPITSNVDTTTTESITSINTEMSQIITITDIENTVKKASEAEIAVVNVLNDTFQFVSFAIMFIFAVILIIAYIYSSFIKINNFFRIGALLGVAIHSMDMLSDVFFSIQATLKVNKQSNNIQMLLISILSICFIFIPTITTIFQLYHEMKKHWLKDNKLRAWLSDNTALIYFVSIITGSSFTSVELFNSYLFNLERFDMGLDKKSLMRYRTKRVYSVVMLENCPQLLLQSWYLFVTQGEWNFITSISLTFTIISVIVAIISMVVEKQILFNQDLIIISFNVYGGAVISKSEYCKNRVLKLRKRLANILGLNKELIEIIRPKNIPNGLMVQANIHLNVNDENETYLEDLMKTAIKNGQLAQSVMNSWLLKSVPSVGNLIYKIESSKMKQRLNTMNSHDSGDKIQIVSVSTSPRVDKLISTTSNSIDKDSTDSNNNGNTKDNDGRVVTTPVAVSINNDQD
eukprot:470118_1